MTSTHFLVLDFLEQPFLPETTPKPVAQAGEIIVRTLATHVIPHATDIFNGTRQEELGFPDTGPFGRRSNRTTWAGYRSAYHVKTGPARALPSHDSFSQRSRSIATFWLQCRSCLRGAGARSVAKCNVRRSYDSPTRKCLLAERGQDLERHALFSIEPSYILECILPSAGLAELETRPSAIRRPTGFLEQQ